MNKLRQRFLEKLDKTNIHTIREFYNSINWGDRLIGIKGQRGVGKTTLLLQYIKKNMPMNHETIYVSLDNIYFHSNTLYSFVDEFVSRGGKYLFLDEVHRYNNWGIEIKNIYDDFVDLKTVYTGSSILQLKKAQADLSRRTILYNMPGLSFREFIYFQTNQNLPILSLDEIITEHESIAPEILKQTKPLALFDQYLSMGYYPYYLEYSQTFHSRLNEIVNMVLEVDIPQFEKVQISHIQKLKQLLYIIANSVPFKPNLNKIAERTGISINTLKLYLQYLTDANLIMQLKPKTHGINSLSKPEKIYLNNTNLIHGLSENIPSTGNLRETFFCNQLSAKENIFSSKYVDFNVNDTYEFEIGGKSKSKKQIANIENAFIVKDNIELGYKNIIPLWIFGFLY